MSAAAYWLTVNADFLAHPGWLAVQKADVIFGPVAIGLYWRRRRPESLFGFLLIGFGFVAAPYILQSSAKSELFTAGVAWEAVRFEVSDNGAGFAWPTDGGGRGIGNVRDRLAAIGGRIELNSEPGRGTVMAGVVPRDTAV